MRARSGELVTTDESTVVAEPFPDTIEVEDRKGNRRFSDPPCADESNVFEVVYEPNNVVDQPVTSETGPGWKWG